MNNEKQKLLLEQLDRKLLLLMPLAQITVPPKGWMHQVRTTLKMSLRQLGKRLEISPQSAKEIEEREASGSITLRGLKEAAEALDMKLVYAFIPKAGSMDAMIEKRAKELASDIVLRTSDTMSLEDQQNSDERIGRAIKSKTEELKNKLPKYLWD